MLALICRSRRGTKKGRPRGRERDMELGQKGRINMLAKKRWTCTIKEIEMASSMENCHSKTISEIRLMRYDDSFSPSRCLSRHFCSFVSRPSPRSRTDGRRRRNVLSFEWKRSRQQKMPLNSRLLSWWTSQGKAKGKGRGES